MAVFQEKWMGRGAEFAEYFGRSQAFIKITCFVFGKELVKQIELLAKSGFLMEKFVFSIYSTTIAENLLIQSYLEGAFYS